MVSVESTNGRGDRTKLNLRTTDFADQQRLVDRRNAEREAQQMAEKKRAEFEAKVKVTAKLTDHLPREGMAPVFFAAARRVAMEVLLGNVPIRNGSDAGAAIKALVDAGRIEAGQATTVTEDITVPPASREEAEKRLKLLKASIVERQAEMANPASGE